MCDARYQRWLSTSIPIQAHKGSKTQVWTRVHSKPNKTSFKTVPSTRTFGLGMRQLSLWLTLQRPNMLHTVCLKIESLKNRWKSGLNPGILVFPRLRCPAQFCLIPQSLGRLENRRARWLFWQGPLSWVCGVGLQKWRIQKRVKNQQWWGYDGMSNKQKKTDYKSLSNYQHWKFPIFLRLVKGSDFVATSSQFFPRKKQWFSQDFPNFVC